MSSPSVYTCTDQRKLDKKVLIKKFLANQANPEEATEASALLNQYPELLEELLPEEEWNTLQEAPIPDHLEQTMDQTVKRATKPFRIPAFIRPLSIAASIFALLAILFLPESAQNHIQEPVAVLKSPEVPEKQYDTIFNSGPKQLLITLDDGSTVKLYGHSALVVPTGMKESRELQLSGKALFEVAKNPNLPFVVKSGAVSTTALGTVFMVDATNKQTAILIALYEGKVVVKKADHSLSIEDTYLLPGQQCDVNIIAGNVAVSAIPKLARFSKPVPVLPLVTTPEEDPALDFIKMPLHMVFDRLENRFNTNILVDSTLVQSKLFTGSFEESDSLELILNIIGTMNKLALVKKGNSFLLTSAVQDNQTQLNENLVAGLIAEDKESMELAPALKEPGAVEADPGTVELTSGGELYKKMALTDLFEHLQNKHKIRIHYNREQLTGLIFTGLIPDNNSYMDMLQVICRMNNLKLLKLKRGIYSVEPQQ